MTSGSVDQTNTYVFEVAPRGVGESTSKSFQYWSTGNGDDTMVSVWNPADEAQDFAFTLYFKGGQYVLPVHLEARETRNLNVSEIIQNQVPDADGNIIPASVHEGTAKIAGSQAETQAILVAVQAGVYNVRKATCHSICAGCNGYTGAFIDISSFTVTVGGTQQLHLVGIYGSGGQTYIPASWNSTDTNVATVGAGTGLVTGVGPGSVSIPVDSGPNQPIYVAWGCDKPETFTCPTARFQLSASGTVKPTLTSISRTKGPIGVTISGVTLSGRGFGAAGTVNAGTGISVTYGSRSDTSITATFAIAANAPGGNHTVTVTAAGQTSAGVNFYVQIPTTLSIVAGTDSTTSESSCSAGNLGTGCGVGRTFTYQVNAQDGLPLQFAGLDVWDSISVTSPNNLGITGFLTTCTPPNTGPCGPTTDSLGQFVEQPGLFVCSTVCRVNNACTTGGPTNANQTVHVGSASIVQQLGYYCDHVTVNGH